MVCSKGAYNDEYILKLIVENKLQKTGSMSPVERKINRLNAII